MSRDNRYVSKYMNIGKIDERLKFIAPGEVWSVGIEG